MDDMLCDELLQDIFTRISKSSPSSSSSSSSVSLVSKRWLHLYRTSKTSLSLRLNPDNSTVQSLASLLPNYPFLSSLSLLFSSDSTITTNSISTVDFNDHLLFIVSTFCSKLKHLRLLTTPVSPPSLLFLSNKCTHLTSLDIILSRPLFFNWVAYFSCLKELSIHVSDSDGVEGGVCSNRDPGCCLNEEIDAELGLKILCLSGIKRDDSGFGWLWRSCKKLKKLQLKSCESIGDEGSFLAFIKCLKGLQEVELKTCRSIIGAVLLRLAENCDSLNSLLIYDGGSQEGLLHFINNCRSNMQKIDFRLPLDLSNVHLSAIAANLIGLSSLRLQSCCLVSGEGLKALGIALNSGLQELSLINCDVVGREPGLLATLGQHLRQLRKLDLSHNEYLLDKEFISMLVSCNDLIELRLRGCKGLSSMTMLSMFKSCKRLECVDIMHCCKIESQAIELFFLNSPRLRRIHVEQSKLSDVARTWASIKFIQVFT